MPFQLISALFQQASAQGSKSTVLRPMGWLIALCGATLIGALEMKAPQWLLILLGSLVGVTAIVYVLGFWYCLLKDRDALRTEKYQIQRLAIEKGISGDSLTGVLRIEPPMTKAVVLGSPVSPEDQK